MKETPPLICSKERELGIMATQIENIKETTDKIDKKMDKLIEELPKTYATKTELKQMETKLMQYNKFQDERTKGFFNFLKNNWDKIILYLAFVIFMILSSKGFF
jgi:hypothetical protein